MAAARTTSRALLLTEHLTSFKRSFSAFHNLRRVPKKSYSKYVLLIGGGVVAFTCANLLKANHVEAANRQIYKREEEKAIKLTVRERRFIKFASVDFDGQLYMTPQDFLDSVVEPQPRPRLKRRSLTLEEVFEMRDKTPALKKGTSHLFRNLRDKGIISYTEYLFLLSILTKPRSGFHIAFNMFDTDGNRRVDIKEFLVIRQILGGSFREHDMDEATRKVLLNLVSTIEQAKQLILSKPKKREVHNEFLTDEDTGLQRKHVATTTTFLLTHFFGPKGSQVLNFSGFQKFMENLQTEVLEIEFNEFSKGHMMITEVDFARILLRYTYLDIDQYDTFLERLLNRVKDQTGISFDEFRDFCRFLNNLEDFSIAMRMYTLANHAISQEEFSRAVKICTGLTLSKHIIDTVFAIFDEDGDGRLSYKEFIAIMRDRLYRGFKTTSRTEGWEGFKYCVKAELIT